MKMENMDVGMSAACNSYVAALTSSTFAPVGLGPDRAYHWPIETVHVLSLCCSAFPPVCLPVVVWVHLLDSHQ